MATVIETPKPICLNNRFKQPSVQDRIYDSEGIATAVTASQFRPKVAERKMFNPYNEKEIKDGSVQIELSQTPVSKNGTVDCRK